MIIDINAYLGHFAFRPLRHHTASALLRLMDAKKIDKAVVSSASAITYRNAQAGNEEVAAEVEGHRDRLIPFAVINPSYAGWRDDLKACHETFGMRGLRLYPKWHNYSLSDDSCLDLIDAATELGWIVSIPIRVEDVRQRSWLVDVPEVPLAEIASLVASRPRARFVLLNGLGYVNSPLGRKGSDLPANYLIELSRMDSLLANEIGQLIANLGADRVVFGTGMPFQVPDSALLKMEVLAADEGDKGRIYGGNMRRDGCEKRHDLTPSDHQVTDPLPPSNRMHDPMRLAGRGCRSGCRRLGSVLRTSGPRPLFTSHRLELRSKHARNKPCPGSLGESYECTRHHSPAMRVNRCCAADWLRSSSPGVVGAKEPDANREGTSLDSLETLEAGRELFGGHGRRKTRGATAAMDSGRSSTPSRAWIATTRAGRGGRGVPSETSRSPRRPEARRRAQASPTRSPWTSARGGGSNTPSALTPPERDAARRRSIGTRRL